MGLGSKERGSPDSQPLPTTTGGNTPNSQNLEKRQGDYEHVVANWTKVVGIFTGLLFVATAYSAYVLHATDETLKETMIVGQRAYVIVGSAKIYNLGKISTDQGVGISYQLQNVGRTPVYDLRQLLFIGIRKPSLRSYDGIPWSRASDIPYFTNTASVQDLEGPGLTPQQIQSANTASIRTATDRLYFVGRLNYRDVFNEQRWTDFCFVYLGGGTRAELNSCEYLNDADSKEKKRRPPDPVELTRPWP